jgi:hypothetical protein
MTKMTKDEFFDTLATYISITSKMVDLSDPDTIVFTKDFDAIIRLLQNKGTSKERLVYEKQTGRVRLLYRQLDMLIENNDEFKVI